MPKIYINTIKQISAQQPLVDEWFDKPIFYDENYVRALEPDYKQFFTPNEVRRLGKILKRALLVSRQAMSDGGVSQPDAIITGTGLGCIENTEIFLDKLVREGEELLNPTHFMQSTHNTISSLVAIDAKCNAYNSTYAHKGISFECALQDAFMQLQRSGVAHNATTTALVGAHDEMTPAYYNMLKKSGYLDLRSEISDFRFPISDMRQETNENRISEIGNQKSNYFAGETAVAMMLSTEKTEKTMCEIEAVEKIYLGRETMRYEICDKLLSQISHLNISNPDYIMVGTNGVEENDKVYFENCAKLFPNVPLLQYKNIFGESYTAPALGIYAAAVCLQRGQISDFMMCDMRYATRDMRQSNIGSRKSENRKSKILCYNHFENKNHTFVLLSSNF